MSSARLAALWERLPEFPPPESHSAADREQFERPRCELIKSPRHPTRFGMVHTIKTDLENARLLPNCVWRMPLRDFPDRLVAYLEFRCEFLGRPILGALCNTLPVARRESLFISFG